MVSDGPYGPSILYSDGSTEPVPAEDIEPPPLTGDLNFEPNRTGFEVWFSERIVRDHEDLIEDFMAWLLEEPEVVSVNDDTVGAVTVLGLLSVSLETNVTAWWATRVEGLEVGR